MHPNKIRVISDQDKEAAVQVKVTSEQCIAALYHFLPCIDLAYREDAVKAHAILNLIKEINACVATIEELVTETGKYL